MGPIDAMHGTRRGFLACASGAFVLACLPSVLSHRRQRLVRRCLPIMGTVADVVVVHDDEARAQRAIDKAYAALRHADRLLSRFSRTSDVGRANTAAATGAVQVCDDTADVLLAAQRWAVASNGAFDPCLGRASGAWDVSHRIAPLREEQIASLAGQRLYAALDVTRCSTPGSGAMVRFANPDVSLDLGGIGKGWAVDRAADALRSAGMERAFVNVGGDLVALGSSLDGDPWRVGVADPLRSGQLLTTLSLQDGAVATSGDAEQYFVHGGRRYHHLIDPATGAPRLTSAHSLTVTAPTCLAADAAATALFGRDALYARDLLGKIEPSAQVIAC